jgi:transposase
VYYVLTMYIDCSTVTINGKPYKRALLRESYREEGKVKHRTIANLSACSDDEIQAMRLALRLKGDLAQLGNLSSDLTLKQGPSVGAVLTLHSVAQRLGISDALGHSREGRLALWQVLARVIEQGSRLSAVRLASSHAACDVLELDGFDEDDLYQNLDWLEENQHEIENRLFQKRNPQAKSELFLYDVTSSYLEGTCNELAAFGYNRDGKTGKRQVVIGLLCDAEGEPLSIEVFPGNTSDTKTMASQVRKAAERFGGGEVTFVGDRGMIKGPQIQDLADEGFHYITAITKPQIEALVRKEVLQLELFEEHLAEVTSDDGVRYVLRRNPVRAAEMAEARQDKRQTIERLVAKQNTYLAEHSRADVAVAVRKVEEGIKRLRLSEWLSVSATDRTLVVVQSAAALAEISKLDGCYCLKTDLISEAAPKEMVHDRYKSLAQVEWAFRSCKTMHLEMRPIHVRLASRTRGHALVVMLAYRIVAELARCWQQLDLTVAEGIAELASLCAIEVYVQDRPQLNRIPQPRESVKQLLAAADIQLPSNVLCRKAKVTTKRKLPERRKVH